MKIVELHKVSKNKIGHINYNCVKNEPSEIETFQYLTLFGFNIEIVKPVITKNYLNADILMTGTLWEVKGPESSNRNTLKIHFKKASKQANKVIFDLRKVLLDDEPVSDFLIRLFEGNSKINRMIIIKKNGGSVNEFRTGPHF